jgi:late competence protein required for DNA uptake (superfamily II DNA/RNA helicase)
MKKLVVFLNCGKYYCGRCIFGDVNNNCMLFSQERESDEIIEQLDEYKRLDICLRLEEKI